MQKYENMSIKMWLFYDMLNMTVLDYLIETSS